MHEQVWEKLRTFHQEKIVETTTKWVLVMVEREVSLGSV